MRRKRQASGNVGSTRPCATTAATSITRCDPVDEAGRGAKLEGEVLTCQWYGARFDVRTVESVFLRSVRPLATYATTVRDGRVFVQLPVEPAGGTSSRWVGAER